MKRLLHGLGFSIAALAFSPLASAQAPTADVLKQVLQQSLLKLRPVGISERNVLFQDVRAGNPPATKNPSRGKRFYAQKKTVLPAHPPTPKNPPAPPKKKKNYFPPRIFLGCPGRDDRDPRPR